MARDLFHDRLLYLAVPLSAYDAIFQREFLQISIDRYQIKLIVYDPIGELIVKWIN